MFNNKFPIEQIQQVESFAKLISKQDLNDIFPSSPEVVEKMFIDLEKYLNVATLTE